MTSEPHDLGFYRYPSIKSYSELVRHLLRRRLGKHLGDAAAVSNPAGDGMAIQEPQHQQAAGFVASGNREVSDGGMPWRSFLATHRIYDIVHVSFLGEKSFFDKVK